LGVATDYQKHAIHALLAAWVNAALGTDDFALFGVGLSDEIQRLHRAGMAVSDLARIRLGPP
jgi:adenosine deaminase